MTTMAEPSAQARGDAPPMPEAGGEPISIWGASVPAMHDLSWGSHCVQVVRPGQLGPVWPHGPALYLLLGAHDLADFDLGPALKRLHWATPDALRVRLRTTDDAYAESVTMRDGVPRFTRLYKRRSTKTARVWITPSADVAARWAAARDDRAAVRALREGIGRESIGSLATPGFLDDGRDPAARRRWLARVMPRWTRPNAVRSDLYEYQRGVWAHESASIHPSARIIGAAWIGAGVVLPEHAVLVGPVILPDARRVESLADTSVKWEEVRSSRWALPSLAGAGTARLLAKRLFDIAFSLVALAITLPLYPFIMLAILFEDGRPFFFAHTRQTLGGKDFPCIKFRTMVKDADAIKAQLVAANVCDGPQFFMADDPRVLKVGRVLRKFQLDELPQFINVLLGHMSVVGPRPSPDKENQFCPAWREARLSVRPGVTGLWQVRRTREPLTDFQEWIRYDLEYVQHQSLLTDVRIIIETVAMIFGR